MSFGSWEKEVKLCFHSHSILNHLCTGFRILFYILSVSLYHCRVVFPTFYQLESIRHLKVLSFPFTHSQFSFMYIHIYRVFVPTKSGHLLKLEFHINFCSRPDFRNRYCLSSFRRNTLVLIFNMTGLVQSNSGNSIYYSILGNIVQSLCVFIGTTINKEYR